MSFTACSSNENVIETTKPIEFAKTTEMLNFESSLKEYFQSKREKGNETSKVVANTQITKDANALLKSIGKSDLASKTNQNTDELVRTAMKEYSKKLTEMYNQQKNN